MSTKKQQAGTAKQTQQTQNKKKKRKVAKHSKFLIFAFVVALIPFIWVGFLLIQAAMQTGSPVNGERYKGDLNPAIVETQLDTIENRIKAANDVENVKITLIGSTLRILVDVRNDMTVDEAKKLGSSLKDEVFSVLDVKTYFTRFGIKKMYDMEIYLVDQYASSGVEPNLNVLVHKTSGMEDIAIEVLTQPKNPEYVESLKEKEAESGSGS